MVVMGWLHFHFYWLLLRPTAYCLFLVWPTALNWQDRMIEWTNGQQYWPAFALLTKRIILLLCTLVCAVRSTLTVWCGRLLDKHEYGRYHLLLTSRLRVTTARSSAPPRHWSPPRPAHPIGRTQAAARRCGRLPSRWWCRHLAYLQVLGPAFSRATHSWQHATRRTRTAAAALAAQYE